MAVGVVVNTNTSSINAARVLSRNRDSLETAMERLASGKRINSAADDAAGLAVAAKMRGQVASLNAAIRNTNDGISFLNTYDGAASEIESMVVRMRELAVQMSSGTYEDEVDTKLADEEYKALKTQIELINTNTEFNRIKVSGADIDVQTGPKAAAADKVDVKLDSLDVTSGIGGSIGKAADAVAEVAKLDTALNNLATARSKAGGLISRLSYALNNAQNVNQRLTEALSGIEDADYATESAAMARGMVLAQAGTAMLAQANQAPQYVLTLLRT